VRTDGAPRGIPWYPHSAIGATSCEALRSELRRMHVHSSTDKAVVACEGGSDWQGLFGKGSYFVDRLGEGLSSTGMRGVCKKDPLGVLMSSFLRSRSPCLSWQTDIPLCQLCQRRLSWSCRIEAVQDPLKISCIRNRGNLLSPSPIRDSAGVPSCPSITAHGMIHRKNQG
jgi:hypothetical protein